MKFMAVTAMALVAFDCFDYATGTQTQHVFTQENLWIWWLIGAGWLLNAVALLVSKYQKVDA